MACNCEFDPYEDGDTEESFHYKRTCERCRRVWWALHCPHDGHQKPCPHCKYVHPAVPDEDDMTPGGRAFVANHLEQQRQQRLNTALRNGYVPLEALLAFEHP